MVWLLATMRTRPSGRAKTLGDRKVLVKDPLRVSRQADIPREEVCRETARKEGRRSGDTVILGREELEVVDRVDVVERCTLVDTADNHLRKKWRASALCRNIWS